VTSPTPLDRFAVALVRLRMLRGVELDDLRPGPVTAAEVKSSDDGSAFPDREQVLASCWQLRATIARTAALLSEWREARRWSAEFGCCRSSWTARTCHRHTRCRIACRSLRTRSPCPWPTTTSGRAMTRTIVRRLVDEKAGG